MSTFLQSDELVELTGIRAGRDKMTREQRQISALRSMKIPHYVNVAGRPVVVRAVLQGVPQQMTKCVAWEPRVA